MLEEKEKTAEEITSDINGEGFGSDHIWQRGYTTQSGFEVHHGDNSTMYVCKKCGQGFNHYYHSTPNIFEAIREVGISEHCPNLTK